MAQVIQIKRRIPGTGGPATLAAGEIATSISAVAPAGIANLYIGDGTNIHDLVSAARQVELTGNQSIAGTKTFTTGLSIAPALLHVTGGNADEILSTDGAGNLSWIEPPSGVSIGATAPTTPPPKAGDMWFDGDVLHIHDGSNWVLVGFEEPSGAGVWGRTSAGAWQLALPLSGGTLTGALTVPTITINTALNIAPGNLHVSGGTNGDVLTTDGSGNLTWEPLEPGGLLSVNAGAPLTGNGTSGSQLLVTPATTAQIDTGTDNVFPITSAGLRHEVGAAPSTLTTTAKTIVPAINELDGAVSDLESELAALSGALRFVGNYDADASEVTTAASGTVTAGSNLPAAASGNAGWFVIVIEPGTPSAPAPTVPMQIGDWIVSTGSQWIHVPLYHTAITAANVSITQIDSETWTNVQQALAGIYAMADDAMTSVNVDGTSIVGNGTSTALAVNIVDGGTF